jgi:hypothetical protein
MKQRYASATYKSTAHANSKFAYSVHHFLTRWKPLFGGTGGRTSGDCIQLYLYYPWLQAMPKFMDHMWPHPCSAPDDAAELQSSKSTHSRFCSLCHEDTYTIVCTECSQMTQEDWAAFAVHRGPSMEASRMLYVQLTGLQPIAQLP